MTVVPPQPATRPLTARPCAGGCGHHITLDDTACPTCLTALPHDLALRLRVNSPHQGMTSWLDARHAATTWLRTNQPGATTATAGAS
jgi:hypothetical protein